MPLTSIQFAIQKKFKELIPSITNEIHFGSVAGGCINETYKIGFSDKLFFCKVNSASKFPHLFEREAQGLKLIARQKTIKVPEIIDNFEIDHHQILLLEWIDEGERTESFWKKFGEQLAALHQVSNAFFGLNEDNYMGSIPQSNKPTDYWIDFFIHQRLQPLVQECLSKKLLSPKHQSQFEKLYDQLPSIFDNEQRPALLHGDLWSGNFMCNKYSEPVLIDTAVYFGHPSADLAMTTLFGGFRSGFYEAYNHHHPFPSNCKDQWAVCNLYPLLIHLILFGSGYLTQIETIVNRYTCK
jgi:protein-ribulosamine 3-kinase